MRGNAKKEEQKPIYESLLESLMLKLKDNSLEELLTKPEFGNADTLPL